MRLTKNGMKIFLSRIIVVCFLLLSGIFSVHAQTVFIDPEISVGVQGGYGASMVNFNPSVDQSFLTGYTGGLVFRYIAEKNVGIQAELNYVQRGWKEADNLYTRQLNYLEIPFMTHLYFGKNVRFYFNIGPKFAYLLSEKVLTDNTVSSTSLQHTAEVQNPFEYGLCGGFGLSFRIQKQIFQIETRAAYSLSDIYSNAKVDYFDASNNMGVSAHFAWLIQFPKK